MQDGGTTILDFEKCQYFSQRWSNSHQMSTSSIWHIPIAILRLKNVRLFSKSKMSAGWPSTMGNKNRKYKFKKQSSLNQVLRACLSYKTANINWFVLNNLCKHFKQTVSVECEDELTFARTCRWQNRSIGTFTACTGTLTHPWTPMIQSV